MASKFRQVVNQVKDTMLGPKDKLVLSEENWDYICQTFDHYERSNEQQKVINAAQKKKNDELGVKLLDEKKRTTTLEERLDGLQKKTENLEQVVATLFEIIEIQQQMLGKDSISKPSVGEDLKPFKDDPALKDNKLPPILQASTASSSISIRKKQIGSTSSKKSNEKNDDAKVPIIRKTKVASASKSTTVKGQKRIGSLLARQEDSISKGESTLNEKKPASSLEKSSASCQMIK